MRSNDAWAGFRNDLAWQRYVQDYVVREYNSATSESIEAGQITWQVSSLHLYSRQFHLIESYLTQHGH
jgi:thymidylate synthase